MVFTNVINPRSHVSRKHEYKTTKLRKGCTIGANATIVCGNEIGQYAMVGAGSVVTKNVLSYELVVGVPAKHLGWVCQCGERILFTEEDKAQCQECKKSYYIKNGTCHFNDKEEQ